jgi:acetoin utilization deacetylase AcuC-like enzyme
MKINLNKILILVLFLFCVNIGFSMDQHKKLAVMYDDRFLSHNTGSGHPENSTRLIAAINELKTNPNFKDELVWPSFSPASNAIISLAHSPSYIKLVEDEISALSAQDLAYLSTGDTVISKDTLEAAKLAVGAGIKAADMIVKGEVNAAFALVRPPGHHATQYRGMGFCVFNNIAILARYLQQHHNFKRILIVDFDVHHGNGTQDIFYRDNSVFYFSIHQHPFYPGTGRPSETGADQGEGFTLNIDLPAGSGDDELLKGLNHQLKPAMDQFKPDFILVSAGLDAHQGDVLGGLNYSDEGYRKAAVFLNHLAKRYSNQKIIYMLEGGYTPENIKNSTTAILLSIINQNF